MLFKRPTQSRPLLIAERFVAPVARLSEVVLPLDVIARQPAARLRFLLLADGGDYRVATLSNPRLLPEESLRLEFAPFEAPAGTSFLLGVVDLSGEAEFVDEVAHALPQIAFGHQPALLGGKQVVDGLTVTG